MGDIFSVSCGSQEKSFQRLDDVKSYIKGLNLIDNLSIRRVRQFDLDRVFNEDCYTFIKKIPNNSVQLIVTDPPYLFGDMAIKTSRQRKTNYYSPTNTFKNIKKLQALSYGFDLDILDELKRICNPFSMYIFIHQSQFLSMLEWCDANKFKFDILVWFKSNSAPFANGCYRKNLEYAMHIRSAEAMLEGTARSLSKFYESATVRDTSYNHPTIKPIELLRRWISVASKPNDIVFDPFCGTGTTLAAAKELGRHYVGCEISPEYYEDSLRRLQGVERFINYETYHMQYSDKFKDSLREEKPLNDNDILMP